jgi:hypothetical protein
MLPELGEADAPTGRVPGGGVACFEHVGQGELAAVVVDRFQLEVQFVVEPGEGKAPGRSTARTVPVVGPE